MFFCLFILLINVSWKENKKIYFLLCHGDGGVESLQPHDKLLNVPITIELYKKKMFQYLESDDSEI